MIDKIISKRIVANLIGDKFVIPILGVWDSFEDIDFDLLPTSFVLKCNHDSDSYVIIHNKSNMNYEETRYRLNNALHRDYYHTLHKQWGYKGIKPRILAEPLLPEERLEIQVFCNNGIPVFFLVRSDLGKNESNGFAICYSMDWVKMDYRIETFPNIEVPKPKNFERIIQFARILSKDTLHLRVDFYELSNGDLYVGELTFYSHGGYFCNFNEVGRKVLSDSLVLPI